jgi:hypothetical protein
MSSSRVVTLGMLCALAAAACAPNEPPEVPPLADELAQAFCTHQFNCCSLPEIATVAEGRYLTEAECLPYATLSADAQVALLESALASGHISIDPAALDACITTYANRACNTSLAAPETILAVPDTASALAPCAGLLVGRLPVGAACTLAEECAPGSHCSGGTSVFGGSAPGSMGTGGTGGVSGPIGPSTGGAVGACVATQALGQPCNSSSDCDPGAKLYCRAPDFTCATLAGAGEACGYDAARNPTIQCDAAKGLFCDPSSTTCRTLPPQGAPCNFSFGPQCDPDPALALSCNFFTDLCVAPGAEGAACGGSALAPCRWDLACVPTQADGIGTCQPAPGLGESCNGPCRSPAACSGGVCRALGSLPVGAPCASNGDCVTLACSPVFGGSPSPVCVAQGPVVCAGNSVTPGLAGMVGVGGKGGAGGAAGAPGAGTGGSVGTMTGGGGAGPGGQGAAGGVSGASGMTGGPGGTGGAAGTGGMSAAGADGAGGSGAGGMSGA